MKIIIPARGGSKRIPNKNLIDLNGKPLISYAIEECLSVTDEVYVSTDCSSISKVSSDYGAKIIERPKKGFQVPFGQWCKTTWRDYMEDNLLSPNLKINSTLNSQGIKMIWNQHLAGRFDYSRQLFALLTLSLWMETYLSSHEQTEEA